MPPQTQQQKRVREREQRRVYQAYLTGVAGTTIGGKLVLNPVGLISLDDGSIFSISYIDRMSIGKQGFMYSSAEIVRDFFQRGELITYYKRGKQPPTGWRNIGVGKFKYGQIANKLSQYRGIISGNNWILQNQYGYQIVAAKLGPLFKDYEIKTLPTRFRARYTF